jgi:hypothetical protein
VGAFLHDQSVAAEGNPRYLSRIETFVSINLSASFADYLTVEGRLLRSQ